MIARFLAMLPTHRRLMEALSDKLRLQDQVASLQGENAWLREQFSKAHDTEREAYQMMANIHYQAHYNFKPYPEAPGLPINLSEETGSVKRPDHFLSMRMNGMKESRAVLDKYFGRTAVEQEQ